MSLLSASCVTIPPTLFSKDYWSASILFYPLHHWVFEPCTLTDPKMIALARFEHSDYAVYLNPADKRGYRSVVRLINNERMASTINREYTSSERIGLALTMALVTDAYSRIVPIAQNVVAGNNAHSFDPKTGVTQLGTSDEPIFLHGHVFGRGNPDEKYIEDIQLDGPIPGLIFDMRAQSPQEPGNDKKVSWKPGDIEKVGRRLKTEIEKIYEAYKAQGLTVISKNNAIDVYIIRHGETDWNIQGKLQGHTNIPLNAQGELQALQLQQKLAGIDFAKIFSSDLTRARATAELVLGPNKPTIIETSPLLRERCMGTWEGRLATELQSHFKRSADLDYLDQDKYISFKWDDTVESYSDVYQRIQTLIRSIFVSPSVSDRPILLSSHGGVLRAILYCLDFQPRLRWKVANCAFLKLRVQVDGQIAIMASEGVKLIKVEEATIPF
jgi:probable phosphoglycerate mutase